MQRIVKCVPMYTIVYQYVMRLYLWPIHKQGSFLIMNINYKKDWIRQKEAEDFLSLGRTTMYHLRSRNLIKWSRIGKVVYYDVHSIEEYLEANSSQILKSKFIKNENE